MKPSVEKLFCGVVLEHCSKSLKNVVASINECYIFYKHIIILYLQKYISVFNIIYYTQFFNINSSYLALNTQND